MFLVYISVALSFSFEITHHFFFYHICTISFNYLWQSIIDRNQNEEYYSIKSLTQRLTKSTITWNSDSKPLCSKNMLTFLPAKDLKQPEEGGWFIEGIQEIDVRNEENKVKYCTPKVYREVCMSWNNVWLRDVLSGRGIWFHGNVVESYKLKSKNISVSKAGLPLHIASRKILPLLLRVTLLIRCLM